MNTTKLTTPGPWAVADVLPTESGDFCQKIYSTGAYRNGWRSWRNHSAGRADQHRPASDPANRRSGSPAGFWTPAACTGSWEEDLTQKHPSSKQGANANTAPCFFLTVPP